METQGVMVDREREELFNKLATLTVEYSDKDYRKIYSLHYQHWGINSPACILYQNFFASHPHKELIPKNFEGLMLIAVNKDAVPDPDYLKYIKEHEYWEHFLRTKKGFNLLRGDEQDYNIPILDRKRPAHRVAVLKELKSAKRDGKLEDYMQWWRSFYAKDIKEVKELDLSKVTEMAANYGVNKDGERARETIILFIKSNLEIREAVYKKLSK